MEFNENISKFYSKKNFQKLYYTGISKFLNDRGHKLLEKDLNESLNYDVTLELGATHGEHFKYVKHQYMIYEMIDIQTSEDLVKLSTNNEKVVFTLQDIESEDFASGKSYDRILMTCLLHHLNDVDSVLKKIFEVLNEGGRIDILVPCDQNIFWKIGRLLFVYTKLAKVGLSISNYKTIIKSEHVNTYREVIDKLGKYDNNLIEKVNWPFKKFTWRFNVYTKLSFSSYHKS